MGVSDDIKKPYLIKGTIDINKLTNFFNYKNTMNSRITRRNKVGFSGEGTQQWVKRNDCGDYKDKYDNNKFINENSEYKTLIHFAKKWGIKHCGSKSLSQLKALYKRFITLNHQDKVTKEKVLINA